MTLGISPDSTEEVNFSKPLSTTATVTLVASAPRQATSLVRSLTAPSLIALPTIGTGRSHSRAATNCGLACSSAGMRSDGMAAKSTKAAWDGGEALMAT